MQSHTESRTRGNLVLKNLCQGRQESLPALLHVVTLLIDLQMQSAHPGDAREVAVLI